MPRGNASKVGDTRVAQNGYQYTRTEAGQRLTHHIIAEEKLGRPLTGKDLVTFVDGDRTNLDPSNIRIRPKKVASLRSQLIKIDNKIKELQVRRTEITQQIKALTS